MDGWQSAVSFRLVQMLSGDGCFGFGSERSTRWSPVESAWSEGRRVQEVGADLSSPALVKAMLGHAMLKYMIECTWGLGCSATDLKNLTQPNLTCVSRIINKIINFVIINKITFILTHF